jgi:peptidoglycan/LPS O-acetylase OafA/YrhL
MVFSFHTLIFPLASPGAEKIRQTLLPGAGYTALCFFFALSGFILAWSVRPGDTAPRFWRRRFFKIYPNHLLTFLASVILLVTVAKVALDGWGAVLNLLLLQTWPQDYTHRTSYNIVAWSLCCEAFFYFCFPFLNKLIDRIRPNRLWLGTILSAASVIALPALSTLIPGGQAYPGFEGFTDRQFWFVFNFPPTQMLIFIFGIFMAKLVLAGQRLPLKFGGAVALAVGAYFVTPLFPPLYQINAVMVVPLGLLIASCAVADDGRELRFLGSRPMVWLGNISYAFYVWHFLVLTYGYQWLGESKWLGSSETWSAATTVAVILLLFAVTMVLSGATYTLVEEPIMTRFATSRRRRDLDVVTTHSGAGSGAQARPTPPASAGSESAV